MPKSKPSASRLTKRSCRSRLIRNLKNKRKEAATRSRTEIPENDKPLPTIGVDIKLPVELHIDHQCQSDILLQSMEIAGNEVEEQSPGKPLLFKNQDLVARSLLGRLPAIKKELNDANEAPSLPNETIFVKAEPNVLIYYRDNVTLAQEDPLETVQVKTEPKTEPVDCDDIAGDEIVIKTEYLEQDTAMTDDRIS